MLQFFGQQGRQDSPKANCKQLRQEQEAWEWLSRGSAGAGQL